VQHATAVKEHAGGSATCTNKEQAAAAGSWLLGLGDLSSKVVILSQSRNVSSEILLLLVCNLQTCTHTHTRIVCTQNICTKAFITFILYVCKYSVGQYGLVDLTFHQCQLPA
jgi:hypothetical protein